MVVTRTRKRATKKKQEVKKERISQERKKEVKRGREKESRTSCWLQEVDCFRIRKESGSNGNESEEERV